MDSENTNKKTSLEDMFSSSDCLAWEVLESYHNNNLPVGEQHAVEKHLVECELCSDALEGMHEMTDLTVNKSIINNINRDVRKQSGLPKPTTYKFEINYQKLAIAASILLIVGVSTVYFSTFYKPKTNNIGNTNSTQKVIGVKNDYQRKAGRAPIDGEETKPILADLNKIEITTPKLDKPLINNRTVDLNSTTNTPIVSKKESLATQTDIIESELDIATTEDKTSPEEIEILVDDIETTEEEATGISSYGATRSVSAPMAEQKKQKKATMPSINTPASFPGGTVALNKYIQSNMIIQKNGNTQDVNDKVIVKFTVKKNGKIVDIKISQSSSETNNKEAIRLINNMPKWQAATQDGSPVESEYSLPIEFN